MAIGKVWVHDTKKKTQKIEMKNIPPQPANIKKVSLNLEKLKQKLKDKGIIANFSEVE